MVNPQPDDGRGEQSIRACPRKLHQSRWTSRAEAVRQLEYRCGPSEFERPMSRLRIPVIVIGHSGRR